MRTWCLIARARRPLSPLYPGGRFDPPLQDHGFHASRRARAGRRDVRAGHDRQGRYQEQGVYRELLGQHLLGYPSKPNDSRTAASRRATDYITEQVIMSMAAWRWSDRRRRGLLKVGHLDAEGRRGRSRMPRYRRWSCRSRVVARCWRGSPRGRHRRGGRRHRRGKLAQQRSHRQSITRPALQDPAGVEGKEPSLLPRVRRAAPAQRQADRSPLTSEIAVCGARGTGEGERSADDLLRLSGAEARALEPAPGRTARRFRPRPHRRQSRPCWRLKRVTRKRMGR